MGKMLEFGERAEGYDIPVLNEREIRASAGILFLATFLSLMLIVFRGNFLPIKFVITLFLTDFLIRVFLSPRFSPTLILGRLIVRGQVPEYVGARQKKFAWAIGLGLSGLMFALMVLANSYSPISGLSCMACLIFLFFESAFGICLGCKFYNLFYRQKAQHCPGEACAPGAPHDIQRTSALQLLIVAMFILYAVLASYWFGGEFSKKPHNLFGPAPHAKTR